MFYHNATTQAAANALVLVPCQLWSTRSRRVGELGLDKDLLEIICSLVEFLVDNVHIFDGATVGKHHQGVQRSVLNHLPVKMNWCLAITDQANAALH